MILTRRICMPFLSLVVLFSGWTVPVRGETVQDKFYRAYFLECSEGNLAGAAKLYAEVASDPQSKADLQSDARSRLAGCTEELACADFAALMPPESLFYAEIKQPGDQLTKLLGQLGLLAGDEPVPSMANRVAVSPVLIRELMGIRGAAVAVTGFDPAKMMPSGVLVFHPGNLEVIRGLIETGLPVGGKQVEPIEGFATYEVEGQALVTLTSRLVVAGTHRSHIVGVVRRLKGEDKKSLATSESLAAAMKDRGDSMFFACLNAKPIMPIVNGFMGVAGSQKREIAMAQAVLDLNSIQTVVAKAGINDDGLSMELAVRLDEGHHNLVYNLLRTPPIGQETLKAIPKGTAAFLAGALGEASSQYRPAPAGSVVTGLDFGRELFANIIGFAAFVLPPEGTTETTTGVCVPDIGAVITVHDASKSEALWTQILGLASMATGAPTLEGAPVEIEGRQVRSFRFPENVTAYFTTSGNDVLVAVSRSAMARALNAKGKGQSILEDPIFAPGVARMSDATTKALFVHPGRCFEIAKRYMPAKDFAEAEPYVATMTDTVVSLVMDHSGELLRFSANVSGLPEVGELVARLITEEREQGERYARLEQAKNGQRWEEVVKTADSVLSQQPNDVEMLVAKFEALAAERQNHEAALAIGEKLLEELKDDANGLNNLAWNLLTEPTYQDQYDEFALRLSEQSNRLTDYRSWMYIDTLALAKFKTGRIEAAVELERKALELSRNSGKSADVENALARFEAALVEEKIAQAGGAP